MSYQTNARGVIASGPFRGFYPAEADAMQAGKVVRGHTAVRGSVVTVNSAGIINTRGEFYGKYPAQFVEPAAVATSGGKKGRQSPAERAGATPAPAAPTGVRNPQRTKGPMTPAERAGVSPSNPNRPYNPVTGKPVTGVGGTTAPPPPAAPAPPGRKGPQTPGERAAKSPSNPDYPQPPNPDDLSRQTDARARIGSVLAEYGLENLAEWVWQQILAGKSDAEVLQDLRNTPEFKQRFPAIEERKKKGLNAISPGEYVAYERQARQLFRASGLPEGFYDSNDDFTRYIAGDMSLAELNDRIGLGRKAMYEVDPQVRATLARDYGIGEGDLIAWFLDDKVAQPLLEKRFTAGTIGAAAGRAGFGLTTRGENEGLAEIGITAEQAQQGFGTLVDLKEITTGLPGQREGDVSRDEQLGAAFRGDARAQKKIENRRSQRQATFRGGGGFASDRDGVSGLGQADRV